MNQETKNFLNLRESTQVIEVNNSSLLKRIIYDYPSEELTVWFINYFTDFITYCDVPSILFEEMAMNRLNSYGKFYLKQIKPFFKQKNYRLMGEQKANRPTGINVASTEKRFIQGRINLNEINKDWLTQGEKGVYLDFTLQMLPDGTVDPYQNLGMLTQDVPKEIYEKEKNLPKGEKTRGPILGNMRENLWEKGTGGAESSPGEPLKKASAEAIDDLPF